MSLDRCLTDLTDRKLISAQRAADMRARYNELVAEYEPAYGPAAAESMASEQALKQAEFDAMQTARQRALQDKAAETWLERMREGIEQGAPLPAKRAHDMVVEMDYRATAIRRQAQGLIEGVLSKHRRNMIGQVREKSDLTDVGRELYGQNTGSLKRTRACRCVAQDRGMAAPKIQCGRGADRQAGKLGVAADPRFRN